MSEKSQFYLVVYCKTYDEKQGKGISPPIGFFVKLKRQYYSKIDALSIEQDAKDDYVMDCSKLDKKRKYPTLGIFDEEEYEQNKNNPIFKNWKTITP